jgi:2-keto-3-deoxy-L-rhamnonate aldolase RhmA
MTLNNIEILKAKCQRGELCVGSIVTLMDPVVSELVGDAGYDFCWVDMEHSTLSLRSVLGHVMALRGTGAASWVRVPWNDPVLIKPVLEMEPAVIVVPMVRNASEAASAVAACRYPPLGVRSYGPSRGVRFGGGNADEYIRAAEDQPLVIVQAEHIDAVNDIDAILATPGLAGVCVGPNDLAGSMGKMGQTTDPDVQAAIDRTITATIKAGKMIGAAIAYSSESVGDWLDKDLDFLAFSSDCLNLYRQAQVVLDDVRRRG